jgi:hypothetical protein
MKNSLINLNKGEYDEGCLKFYARKNTEGLLREYRRRARNWCQFVGRSYCQNINQNLSIFYGISISFTYTKCIL